MPLPSNRPDGFMRPARSRVGSPVPVRGQGGEAGTNPATDATRGPNNSVIARYERSNREAPSSREGADFSRPSRPGRYVLSVPKGSGFREVEVEVYRLDSFHLYIRTIGGADTVGVSVDVIPDACLWRPAT